jgi:hypothetical protein
MYDHLAVTIVQVNLTLTNETFEKTLYNQNSNNYIAMTSRLTNEVMSRFVVLRSWRMCSFLGNATHRQLVYWIHSKMMRILCSTAQFRSLLIIWPGSNCHVHWNFIIKIISKSKSLRPTQISTKHGNSCMFIRIMTFREYRSLNF